MNAIVCQYQSPKFDKIQQFWENEGRSALEKSHTMIGLTTFERRQNILRLLADQPGLRVTEMSENVSGCRRHHSE